jgi:uncharacterized protein (PEP-CTERM system associated)
MRWAVRSTLGTVALAAQIQAAAAFPLTEDQAPPQGTELAAPDEQTLQHQMDLANGLVPPVGGGWIVMPYVNVQAMATDNALQAHEPRQWDLMTYLSPGIHLAGNEPRLQLTFDYAPGLSLYARTSSLNALTQQANGVGNVTVVPDLLFVDLRAVAGVQNLYGGIGGLGTIGTAGPMAAMQPTNLANLGGLIGAAGLGLTRDQEVQTSSVGISPYLLRQFGDWGTGKLGYSFNAASSNMLTGFAASPFPTGGNASQTMISNQEIAHFDTGDFMQRLQDSFDVNLQQSQTNGGYGYGIASYGSYASQTSFTIIRDYVSNKLTYQVNHTIAVFGSAGWENINYGQAGGYATPNVNDATWSVGTTLTPSPDSTLTVSYGHLNGFNSFTVNGQIAVTARTTLSVSYLTSAGTQLEYLNSQLNLASYNANGTLVNGQTGGQLYGATNALPVQGGILRTDTLNVGSRTLLDRDTLTFNLLWTQQTGLGGIASVPTSAKTATGQWLHQLRPDLTLSAAAAFSLQDGFFGYAGPGNATSVAASVGLQYRISDKLAASLQYSFFDRQAGTSVYSFYQNMLILGISKSF